MKIKNLTGSPVELGDGQMIGAAGTTSDNRKYGLGELTARDRRRVERGTLEIVNQVPAVAQETSFTTSEAASSDAQKLKKETRK